MKAMLIVAVAVATAASPALAASAKYRHHKPAPAPYAWQRYGGAYAAAPGHSPNPAWDVYGSGGRYKGSDPDPLIRDAIRRDNQNTSDSD